MRPINKIKKLSEMKGILRDSKFDTRKIIMELRKERDMGKKAELAEIKEALRDIHECGKTRHKRNLYKRRAF